MGKSGVTILGFAVLAGAVIYVGQSYLNPAGEKAERDESVLTGALDPRIEYAELLEDADLPEGIDAPKVGDLTRFMRVLILYPDQPRAPDPMTHKLTQVSAGTFDATPVHGETSSDAEGARIVVVYRVSAEFEWGRIERDEKVITERFVLD